MLTSLAIMARAQSFFITMEIEKINEMHNTLQDAHVRLEALWGYL